MTCNQGELWNVRGRSSPTGSIVLDMQNLKPCRSNDAFGQSFLKFPASISTASILIALGMIVLLSGGFLWQWSMATTVQESGIVGGTTYGPLSQSHEVKTAYPDTVLTVHCKSVQAVQV